MGSLQPGPIRICPCQSADRDPASFTLPGDVLGGLRRHGAPWPVSQRLRRDGPARLQLRGPLRWCARCLWLLNPVLDANQMRRTAIARTSGIQQPRAAAAVSKICLQLQHHWPWEVCSEPIRPFRDIAEQARSGQPLQRTSTGYVGTTARIWYRTRRCACWRSRRRCAGAHLQRARGPHGCCPSSCTTARGTRNRFVVVGAGSWSSCTVDHMTMPRTLYCTAGALRELPGRRKGHPELPGGQRPLGQLGAASLAVTRLPFAMRCPQAIYL